MLKSPLCLLALAAALTAGPAQAEGTLFMKGDKTLHGYASHTFGDSEAGEFTSGRFGFSHYFTNNFAFQVDLHLGSFDAHTFDGHPGGAGYVAGVDLVVKWAFFQSNNWAIFLEGGSGPVRFEEPFPSVATRTNFESQVGVGFTRRLGERSHLLTGVRYIHVSNADQFGATRNPGFDGIYPYLGVGFKL